MNSGNLKLAMTSAKRPAIFCLVSDSGDRCIGVGWNKDSLDDLT